MVVFTTDTFDYATAIVGDLVDADVVMNAMNCMPPVTMRRDCAQLGEPYSHRKDGSRYRPTFATFKCVDGDFMEGVWEFCGYCFSGETKERGEPIPYYL